MDSTWEAFFNQIRKRLYRRLHVLAKPLARMSDEPAGPSVFPSSFAAGSPEFLCATDGLRVFWNLPLLSYMIKENPAWQDSPPEEMLSAIEAFLLHQVIHCLFGHPFSIPPACPPRIWSQACDIAAWHILEGWIPELLPESLRQWLKIVSEKLPEIPLYQARLLSSCLKSVPPCDPVFAAPDKFPFSDSHNLWPILQKGNPSAKPYGKGGSENVSGTGIPSAKITAAKSAACHWKKLQKQLCKTDSPLSLKKQEKNRRGNPECTPRPLDHTPPRPLYPRCL